MAARSPREILTRHFLRRFLENDLLSPEADRSQLVAILGATCFCCTLFVTVVLSCFKYVIGVYTPGQAAIMSLGDKFFYIGLSMVVSALLAASQWDALAIEPRDAAILEPLPVPASTIRRAKLTAVAQLGAAAALLLNLAPTAIFPLLLLVKQRVGILSALLIPVTHAVVTVAAAVFGYMAIIALRELCIALVGQRLAARAAPIIQGVLVIALTSTVLLLPGVASQAGRGTLPTSAAMTPITWYLGVYETVAGRVLVEAPRGRLAPRLIEADRIATARYRVLGERFGALARFAVVSLAGVLAIALLGHAWNARRAPRLAPPSLTTSHSRSWLGQRLRRILVTADGSIGAGFDFTLAVMWRSGAHRLLLACATAVALAITVVALSRVDLENAFQNGRAATRLLAAQPLLYGALLVGFRQAIRVPVSLRSNWTFQLTWRGHIDRYLAGARRAALVSLVLPSLAVVFPLIAFALGPSLALQHAAIGFAGAVLLLEVLLLNYQKIPFTCALVPDESLKALGPIYLVAFVVGAFAFARTQSAALVSAPATITLIAQLLAAAVVCRLIKRWLPRPGQVEFDAAPEGAQQLGLHS